MHVDFLLTVKAANVIKSLLKRFLQWSPVRDQRVQMETISVIRCWRSWNLLHFRFFFNQRRTITFDGAMPIWSFDLFLSHVVQSRKKSTQLFLSYKKSRDPLVHVSNPVHVSRKKNAWVSHTAKTSAQVDQEEVLPPPRLGTEWSPLYICIDISYFFWLPSTCKMTSNNIWRHFTAQRRSQKITIYPCKKIVYFTRPESGGR